MANPSATPERIRELRDCDRAIVETAPESLLVLDRDLRVKTANRSFYQTFRTSPGETENRPLDELDHGQWNIPGLRARLEKTLADGAGFEDFEVEREFSDLGRKTLLLSARLLRPDPAKLVLLTIEDGAEHRRTQDAIRALLRVGEKLNSTLEPEALLDDLVEEAIQLVGAESGCAGLRQPEGMVCHKYRWKSQVLTLQYCWPPGRGLPGWLIQNRSPYLTNDAPNDPQVVHELCLRLGIRSALAAPVFDSKREVLGFLVVHNKQDSSGFTSADLEKLMAVSQAASVAVQNALASEQIQRAQESIRLYGDVIRNMQLGLSVWHLEHHDDVGSFRLVDSNPAAARASGAPLEKFHGKTLAESFPKLLETRIPWVLREVVLTGEVRDLGEFRYGNEHLPEAVFTGKVFPLRNDYVGTAFENTTQRSQLEGALHLLVEVTAAANEAEDIPTITSRCLEEICKLRGWQVGQAWVLDSEKKALVLMPDSFFAEMEVAEFRKASLEAPLPEGSDLPGRVWQTRAPVWISNVIKDPSFGRSESARRAGLRGAFAFPITSGEKLFAIFEFFSAEIRTPDAHFLSAVAKLGTHLGIVYERKRAEELLRREKEFTERLINSTGDGILAFDRQCRYTMWNPAMERIFGVSREKTLGRCAFDVFPFLKETGEDKFFFEALAGKSVIARDRSYRVLGMGREGFYEADYSPIRDASGAAEGHGEVIGGLAIIHDTTERKRAEQALEESEARYRELFENANDVIYIADLEGNIIDLNAAAERVIGYNRQEALRMNLDQLIAPDCLDRALDEMLCRKMAAAAPTAYEVDILAKDGRRVALETSARLVMRDGEPVAVQGMARDVTERKRVEKSLRELSARLIHAQDEERRRIARDLHDSTAQTLSALAANLALLKEQAAPLGGNAWRVLLESEALMNQVSREIRTVAQLLHPRQLAEAGLASAVRGYATSFAQRSGVELDLDVRLNLGARLPQEIEIAILRILQESLANIHRHSESPTAKIRLALEDRHIALEVSDEGRGIPPEILNSGSVLAGLGVGLAGMRERAQQLGGRLEIDCSGGGTTVKATLPLSAGHA